MYSETRRLNANRLDNYHSTYSDIDFIAVGMSWCVFLGCSALAKKFVARSVQILFESLVPQDLDNLLIGGKSIAVSHIVNGCCGWSDGSLAS